MDKNRSLYEVLGVLPSAEVAEIRGAFTQQLASLENSVTTLDAAEVASAKQMLRIAAGTLLDASSRLSYDAKLRETRQASSLHASEAPPASSGSANSWGLSLAGAAPNAEAGVGDSMKLRADALALRAESLSLKADAMLLQAGQRSLARASEDDGGPSPSAWINVLSSGPLLRILMFLVVLAAVAFGISRCAANAPLQGNTANTQAMERAALQDYFQTHGVKPANMAELERLETERRRSDNEQRNTKQDADKTKREEREFEEESRRRAQVVSDQLRADEERQQQAIRRDQIDAEREARERKESERRAEEQRIKSLENQWRQTLERK